MPLIIKPMETPNIYDLSLTRKYFLAFMSTAFFHVAVMLCVLYDLTPLSFSILLFATFGICFAWTWKYMTTSINIKIPFIFVLFGTFLVSTLLMTVAMMDPYKSESMIYEENCEILSAFEDVSVEKCLSFVDKDPGIYGWEVVKDITGDDWRNTEWTGYSTEKLGTVIDNPLLTDHDFGEFPVYHISSYEQLVEIGSKLSP